MLSNRYHVLAGSTLNLVTVLLYAVLAAGTVMLVIDLFESVFFFVYYSSPRPTTTEIQSYDVTSGTAEQLIDGRTCCHGDRTTIHAPSAFNRKPFIAALLNEGGDICDRDRKEEEFRHIYMHAIREQRQVALIDVNSGFAETNV